MVLLLGTEIRVLSAKNPELLKVPCLSFEAGMGQNLALHAWPPCSHELCLSNIWLFRFILVSSLLGQSTC